MTSIRSREITRKVIPLGEYVLVEAIKSDVSEGGVILPDSVAEKRGQGHRVLDVGEEVILEIEAGDTIIINGNGALITMDGIKHETILIKEDQVLAVLQDITKE